MKLLLIALFYLSTLGWIWGETLASKNKEGNRLYKEGKVDEALSIWRDAQIENPNNNKLRYNIGNGLYWQKKYEGAFNEYEKSLGLKDSGLRSKAYYNMGNTHYRMDKLQEAIEDYKKCLEIDPKDEDAKYNIEFIKKKLEEKEKQKESQQKENKSEDQKQSQASQSQAQKGQQEEQKQEAAQKSEEAKDKEDKQDQTQEQKEEKEGAQKEKKPEDQKPEEKPAEEEKKDEMSKEDAVRLLDVLKDDEKDIQKELRNQPVEGRYKVDKDW